MGPESSDITPVCQQSARTRERPSRSNLTNVARDSGEWRKIQLLKEKAFEGAATQKARELLWRQIVADLDCNPRAAAATFLPRGCELPHCHHASSLGR